MLPYHEVIGIHRDGDQVTGARVRDVRTGEEIDIEARVTVNAVRRLGRPDRGAWPGSRASACSRAGGS